MELKNTMGNANDNSHGRGLLYYQDDEQGSCLRRLVYRDLAHYLISTYCSEPYKSCPESMPFETLEMRVVWSLELAQLYHPYITKSEVERLARCLGTSPLLLYNDPSLPYYLKL
jgi:hypothetical protein